MGHNILVTGANGQLGNEMRLVADNSKNRYIFTDVAELDITDPSAIKNTIDTYRIDIIVNCAAFTNVDLAEDNFELANLLNNKAVENLATAACSVNATLIHISTDYVFPGSSNIPYDENCPTNSLGVYGKTKLAGEHAVLAAGCRYMIFRTAWLCSSFGKTFVKTMQRLTAEKESIKVIFDQVGTPTYAKDLAALIYKIIEEERIDQQGIYHFSNEGVCSWYDFAQEICAMSGHVCEILPCHSNEFPSKVKRPHFSVLDKTKVKETFGVKIPYWKDSLRKCIKELDYENNA